MKKVVFILSIFSLFMCSVIYFGDIITVTDMVGREVKVPLKIERVVTTYKPATQFIFALKAQEKLVGVDTTSTKEKLFILIYPEIQEMVKVGTKRDGINIETVASLNPDLVILFPHNDADLFISKLEKLGIATIIINPESLEEIRETNKLLGKVLGLEEKAKVIDDQFEAIMKLLERTRNIPYNERKTVYFANLQFLDTAGEGLLQTDMIEWAGGINPAAESKKGFITISPEQLIVWDPDFIVISQNFQEEISELLKDPKYQNIKAFKNKQIYRFPSPLEPWDYPSPSSYLGMLWLVKLLYPDLYSDVDFDKIVDDFYFTLYGISYNDLLSKL